MKILLMMPLPESFIFVIGQLEKSIAWIGIHLRNGCILVHFALLLSSCGLAGGGDTPQAIGPNIHTQRTVQENLATGRPGWAALGRTGMGLCCRVAPALPIASNGTLGSAFARAEIGTDRRTR
ncbi:hypothetical protein X727_28015 [Mesorhizobium sp. L103C119B0]|nr:hypothetical protein X771_32870 [Mesorhizobium sp. LSJC277A00]ESW62948.1 hypothetical protein X773_33955 [Mesorhizobium sp. LSJC285A00]ESW94303.1 hypothetical protein X768_34455 [Mesorhizobium sp. LSJC265A00]ESX66672.1 hypothetical protein X757_31435 [Mesorhizobium sp. LSHC414A00]ESY07258.1 hypothetical protein X751_31755 [Mesorhizobium sp. LNJC395A00]ESY47423.1 hypothetical protein X744_32525 [Mesorhizobium sp. LNJC372A00]ESZ56352.1 hypothetical protein X728_26880 [Mesorhizobium sp. L103C